MMCFWFVEYFVSSPTSRQVTNKKIFSPFLVSEDELVIKDDHVVPSGGLDKVDLSFEGLKLTLETKKGVKEILNGSVRGRARPGRMLAVMGPSGT